MSPDDIDQALACSPFLRDLDRRHPDWLPGLKDAGRLADDTPPAARDLRAAIDRHGLDGGLRRFRNREMLRLTAREITGVAALENTLADLTGLAELCLDAAIRAHEEKLRDRFGTPRDASGVPQSLVVLGLGKLGGEELNLSSDIDIVFTFPSAGACDGRRGLANEQYFTRLARAIIGSLSERTEDGFCFRVDTRLRPFGEAGPLVCSFGALEQYYQREGRDWERYALVKSRTVAGDRAAGAELLERLTPFVYRRYIDFGAVEALRAMLDDIRRDAARRDRAEDVKRGPGGIREVEFLVQCAQLLRGGREPALRTPSLLRALEALGELQLFPAERVRALRGAYHDLRRLENAIQAQHDQQTHRLPAGEDRECVARIMGEQSVAHLEQRLADIRGVITTALDESFPREEAPPETPGNWTAAVAGREEPAWRDFRQRLNRMALSGRGRDRLDRFMPRLLDALDGRSLPEAALGDVLTLVLAICRRSAYLSLLVQKPLALERMLDLFAASAWVADTVIRHPALLDELIDPALGEGILEREELSAMAERLGRRRGDEEEALNALNYLKRAQSLRIAVAELNGNLSSTAAERRLTELAEVLLSQCLALAAAMLERRHGRPAGGDLAVVGYGSLGAGDISYGSDLDLVFLYPAESTPSGGPRPLAPETWYTRLVRRLLALVTTVSPSGRLYEVDTRLRPNGRSGLLVSPITAFERYQREDAWVWEWQALTRARPVAGDAELGQRFRHTRDEVLATPRDRAVLRREVAAMRGRMRETAGDRDAFKHGPGGLMDIDFVAQLGVLELGPTCAALRATTGARDQLRRLGALGWLSPGDAGTLVETHVALTRARHLEALCRSGCGAIPDRSASARICAGVGIGEPAGDRDSR